MSLSSLSISIRRSRRGDHIGTVRILDGAQIRFRSFRLHPASFPEMHAEALKEALARCTGPAAYQLPLPLMCDAQADEPAANSKEDDHGD